ncbi:MAG: hypothetical protein COX52_10385 [Syntrophobacterales bacterium CG23_combo_of_CG06-09_8_20_14_all_48_27]|nr:MAG: hypothetical protein COX52_10385 [Syntrophobacterales bacterium CG23_combo_of_CG06-09_8_20_14_all_48_27]
MKIRRTKNNAPPVTWAFRQNTDASRNKCDGDPNSKDLQNREKCKNFNGPLCPRHSLMAIQEREMIAVRCIFHNLTMT